MTKAKRFIRLTKTMVIAIGVLVALAALAGVTILCAGLLAGNYAQAILGLLVMRSCGGLLHRRRDVLGEAVAERNRMDAELRAANGGGA